MKQPDTNIKLIVGLGNPGERYARTYHNAGSLALDSLLKVLDASPLRAHPKFSYAYTTDRGIVLLKPLLSMNESGRAVYEMRRRLRCRPHNILVLHDDSDLPLGALRLVLNRGSAGHHGVESIGRDLRTKEFWRLRIGVRTDAPHPQGDREKASRFVLKTISPRDFRLLTEVFERIPALLDPLISSQKGRT